ncbi:MAG: hypothetical protein KF901_02155 [Myxococcales bacterium]|nr:hypothetical protein [Myxococcales bacterium]
MRYLQSYLHHDEIRARTMVVEHPYVDRHYLQEFVGHYATMLQAVPNSTTRIHLFSEAYDESAWTALIERADESGIQEVEAELRASYLGYVVVRPLPACPIGRTALVTYRGVSSRKYAPAHMNHEVHLHGLTLSVEALPFQQQDQALGACATTALWSALARVMRADGGRAATPLEVAQAVPGARGSLVASPEGLTFDEMRGAIRGLGYQVHAFRASQHDNDEFLLALKTYVQSGIPVVLRIRVDEGELHAVAVTGFRLHDEDQPARDLSLRAHHYEAKSAGLSRLYVHDDRLGPYARFVFVPPSEEERIKADENGYPPLLRIAFKADSNGTEFEPYSGSAIVESALVPLYPKIRTTATALLECATEHLPLISQLAGGRRDELTLDSFFALGGRYLRDVGRVLHDRARLGRLRREALLSRYVGVLRFSVGSEWLVDLVIDTTDVLRGRHDSPPILACVASDTTIAESLRLLAAELPGRALVV